MKRLAKYFFYFLFFLGIAGLIAWICIEQDLNMWVGIAIFFAIIGLWIGIMSIRLYFARRRMRIFVDRMVRQEKTALAIEADSKLNAIKALQKRWQESIKLVSAAKTRNMPWFLLLGAEESGKTSAIKNACLNTAVSSLVKNIGISATENCDWWFLDKSIVLDTAGRYVVPADVEEDSEEWFEFLNLLANYSHKRKPLNGIVITITAQRLIQNDTMLLRDEGQNLRKCIDSLMRNCWAKFPVYILITKMDQVFGFSQTFLDLTKAETDQAAGYINTNRQDWQGAVNNFLTDISQRLSAIRSTVMNELAECHEPGVIILPQEFLALGSGLTEFAKAIFENNPYQEQPFCRGIFLSSAQQTSSSVSTIIHDGDDYLSTEVNSKDNSRGLFLRDFFDKVLPQDKDLVQSAYNSLKWRYILSSISLIPILCLFVALASLYTASYIHNRNILNQFLSDFRKPPVMTNDINLNLQTLAAFQVDIKRLEKSSNAWFVPTLGLNNSSELVKRLKVQYVGLYEEGFINRVNQQLYSQIDQIDQGKSTAEVSLYIEFLTTMINVVKHNLNNDINTDANALVAASKLETLYPQVLRQLYPDMPVSIADLANDTNNSYLKWNDNRALLNINLRTMLKTVHELLTKYPNWQMIKKQSVGDNLSLSDFWGISADYATALVNEAIIPGMYTKKGMAEIKSFISLMEEAGLMTGDNAPELQNFWAQYRVEYFTAWQNFALSFNHGAGFFKSDNERKSLAAKMASESNPYQQFLQVAAEELATDEYLTNPPDWVRLIIELNNIQKDANSAISTTNLQQKVLEKIDKVIPTKAKNSATIYLDHLVQVRTLFDEYNKALLQSYPDFFSEDSYAQYVGQIFSEYNGKSEQKSAITTALIKFNQIQQLFKNYDDSTLIVWQLKAGPLNYLLSYLMSKSSCAIEHKWEGDVIGKLSEVPLDKTFNPLLDKKSGLLWKYVETISPFLSLSQWGYSSKVIYANTLFTQKINFDPKFIKFLNRVQPMANTYQDQYAVNIGSVPISVNDDASVQPYGVILSVQCADGEQVLKNYNYPSSLSFNWSPEKCGTTTLSILFPNLTLTKTFSGTMGFPQFLAMFKTGSHKFSSADFAEADTLENSYDIDWIKVNYTITQNIPAMGLLKDLNTSIPQNAAECNNYL